MRLGMSDCTGSKHFYSTILAIAYAIHTCCQVCLLVVSRYAGLQACQSSPSDHIHQSEGQNGRLKAHAEMDAPGETMGGVFQLCCQRQPILWQLLLELCQRRTWVADYTEMDA